MKTKEKMAFFTLIELLIVIAIIAILAAMLVKIVLNLILPIDLQPAQGGDYSRNFHLVFPIHGIISALAFGFYTIMTVVIVSSPLDNWTKGLITAIVNFIGTYFVKFVEMNVRKQRLGLVDVVIFKKNIEYATEFLNNNGIWFSQTPISNSESTMFHIYSNTQDESRLIRKLLAKFNAKYVVVESKSL